MTRQQCTECGGIGHHVAFCDVAEAEWAPTQGQAVENAPNTQGTDAEHDARINAQLTDVYESWKSDPIDDCVRLSAEKISAMDEIMAHFIDTFGRAKGAF